MRRFVGLLLLLIPIAACAGRTRTTTAQPGPTAKISDQDFARIPASHLSASTSARQAVMESRDAATHADAAVLEAKNRIDSAKADLGVRQAEAKAAHARLDYAKAGGTREALDTAQRDADRADAAVQVAMAEVEVASQQREHLAAVATLAHKRESHSMARLELARLDALRASGDVAADHYDRSQFERALADAQSDVMRAETAANDTSMLDQAQARLDQARAALDRVSEEQPVRGVEPTPTATPQ